MHDKYLLMNLQKRFKSGGYVLVAPKSGRVYAYGKDVKELYQTMDKKNIPAEKKLVMFVPRPDQHYVL